MVFWLYCEFHEYDWEFLSGGNVCWWERVLIVAEYCGKITIMRSKSCKALIDMTAMPCGSWQFRLNCVTRFLFKRHASSWAGLHLSDFSIVIYEKVSSLLVSSTWYTGDYCLVVYYMHASLIIVRLLSYHGSRSWCVFASIVILPGNCLPIGLPALKTVGAGKSVKRRGATDRVGWWMPLHVHDAARVCANAKQPKRENGFDLIANTLRT